MHSGLGRYRGSLTLLATLFVIMFVGAALTGGFYASADRGASRASAEGGIEQAAAITRSGMELALRTLDPALLDHMATASDSVILRAHVSTLDGLRGPFTARVLRASATRGVLTATGALEAAPAVRCSARIAWDLDGPPPSPSAAATAPCVADPHPN